MLVFDASGSMAGTDWGKGFAPRIARVKEALEIVLPRVTPVRNVGLIVYGPGPYNKCDNIELRLQPQRHSSQRIMRDISALVPAGRTPLTTAVRHAADVLVYRERPAVIVLLTDGEETCGGAPCQLARLLKSQAKDLTIHVIGYAPRGAGDAVWKSRCMAEETAGLYVSVETTEELIDALQKTLACPLVSMRDEGQAASDTGDLNPSSSAR
ncbi:MAG: VWA domain-containing protein [Hyphomicrobiaceae bacterium]|nr:VWA domain-containing protein [Hyphomicrobiaceae bacterium]